MCSLTQQEQVLAQSQGGWLSPGGAGGGGGGGGGREGDSKAVDIIQMLSKARTEYDKVWHFLGSSVTDSGAFFFSWFI